MNTYKDDGTPLETQHKLVDLWLSDETNRAKIVLEAFAVGVREGRRQQACKSNVLARMLRCSIRAFSKHLNTVETRIIKRTAARVGIGETN